MVHSKTQVTLELLDGAVLLRPAQAPLRLERKTAALLAYLALEGPTPRSALAGLLWPDSLETTARGNLRQLLRRLRDGAGADLVAGDDPLLLGNQVSVDAVQLELGAFAGDDAAVIAGSGELLEGMDFEDCADLTDWLLARRESLSGLKVAALERLADASEQGGDFRTALLHAQQLLELDAVSEVAHRRVMRLHYLSGDRGAALRAYQRCAQVMQRELGVAPLPETTALARNIEIGQQLELPRQMRFELPLSVQRPPLLVGREPEWAALESAWEAGLGIAVSGEAGVGKSRLTLEFVASKGQYALVQGRPGDASVPYSTLARSLRQTLADHPELKIAPWVRLELSRLIPSLTTETPPAISSDEGKLRFFESMAAVLEPLIDTGVVALVIEDLQFADAASLEAGQYLATRFVAPSGAPRLRSLSTYRSGELRGDTEALIQQSVSAGQVALIDLKPLEPPQLEALLAGLGVALPSGLPALLGRHSGGNPLFALETLRSLIERGDLTRDLLTERLPVPKRLEALVAGRLERLTPAAQRLTRCAAVAGTDFGLELAQAVLETPLLELSEALSELEAAQVMSGERFQHDLVLEAVLSGIGASVKRVLHCRCAEFLQDSGDPIRVADHWLGGGDPTQAIPHLLKGAKRAKAQYQLRAASQAFARAAALLEESQQPQAAFAAYQQQLEVLVAYDLGEERQAVVQKLLTLARTSAEQVIALTQHADLLGQLANGVEAERVAQNALELAEALDDPHLTLRALNSLAAAVFTQRQRTADLIQIITRARSLAANLGLLEQTAECDSNLGTLHGQLDQQSSALMHHHRAVTALRRSNDSALLVEALTSLAAALGDSGQPEAGISVLDETSRLLRHLPENTQRDLHLQLNRLGTLIRVGRYRAALEGLGELKTLAVSYPDEMGQHLPRMEAELMLRLGAFAEAAAAIETALNYPQASLGPRVYALIHRADMQSGEAALRTLEQAEALIGATQRPLALERLRLCKVPLLLPRDGLELVQHSRTMLAAFDLPALELTAQLRSVQCHWRLGNLETALNETRKMQNVSAQITPELVYRGELWLTIAQVLIAARESDAHSQLKTTLDWLLETTRDHVPNEYRSGFVSVNPVNRAILELARAEGMTVSL